MTDHKQSDGAPPREIRIDKKKANWLLWLLLALVLIIALFALSRCHHKDAVATKAAVTTTRATQTTSSAMPAVGVQRVTLPNGSAIDVQPQTLNYDLQRYLASSDAPPRTFTFDQLNFDTASAAIRSPDQPTLAALSQILAAYPKASVKLVGYADARGSDPANVKLGRSRADAVAYALAALGVQASRLATASGGESNPVGSNATAGGQFANRRTELVVTSK